MSRAREAPRASSATPSTAESDTAARRTRTCSRSRFSCPTGLLSGPPREGTTSQGPSRPDSPPTLCFSKAISGSSSAPACACGSARRLRTPSSCSGPFDPLMTTLKRAYDADLLTDPDPRGRAGKGTAPRLRPPAAPVEARAHGRRGEPLFSRAERLQRPGRRPWAQQGRRRDMAGAAPDGRARDPSPAGERREDSIPRQSGSAGSARRFSAARLKALRPLLALSWGEPSDAGIAALDGFGSGDPDLAGRGAIYGNAVSCAGPRKRGRRRLPSSAGTGRIPRSRGSSWTTAA